MGWLGLILLLFITLPVFFILIFLNIVTISFSKLGLSPDAAFMLLFAILIGSMINIPISRRRIAYQSPRPSYMHFFFYKPPPVTHQVITVNVGGAIVPVCFALYLLQFAPSAHDKRRNKRIDRELKEERKCRLAEVYSCNKITLYCEADTIAQLERLKALPSPYYQVDGQVHEVPVYTRGRPSKSGPRKVAQRQWQIKAMIL